MLAIVDATIPLGATPPKLTVTGATFESNAAAAFGGGVALLGYDSGTVSVQDSTFTGNTAKAAEWRQKLTEFDQPPAAVPSTPKLSMRTE